MDILTGEEADRWIALRIKKKKKENSIKEISIQIETKKKSYTCKKKKSSLMERKKDDGIHFNRERSQ